MLDIRYDGTHVNFVTADDVLDVKEFQKKNLQEDIIEKMLLLWKNDYISFDQATEHYQGAQHAIKNGVEFPFKEVDGKRVMFPCTFEEYPLYTNWLALTLYNQDDASPEDYEKYEHLYEEKYFKSLIDGLNEMFGVNNILEYTDTFQLFLTPAAPQFAIRDQFDLQCEHVSVQLEDDWTPREIGRSVESDRWKFWTAYKWRKEYEIQASVDTFPPYGYHHDPYNFIWFRLDKSKRLITRNIERENVIVKSDSVIGFDGFMHEGDPSSWGISMRLSLLDSFWENTNHESEICRKLVNHVRGFDFIPAFPKKDGATHGNDWGLSFLDYKFINDNDEWLSDDEYRIEHWQHYWWWETEPALKFKEEVRKYRRTK